MKKYNFVNLLVLFAFFLSFNAQTALCSDILDRPDEVNQHIDTLLTGTLNKKIDAAKIIERSGYTDQKLFDVIENELLEQYLITDSSIQVDYIAWLCKALASSGMERYKPTLQKVIDTSNNKKIKRHAEESLNRFEQYAKRAEIISDNKYAIPGRDPEVARLINMLKSNEMTIKRDAAKLISRNSYSDPDLFKVVNDELLNGYNISGDNVTVDTMSWLCLALANSDNSNYKNTLQTIVDTAGSDKLVKYAKKALSIMN